MRCVPMKGSQVQRAWLTLLRRQAVGPPLYGNDKQISSSMARCWVLRRASSARTMAGHEVEARGSTNTGCPTL
jgi:hypothetical protein